MQRSHMLHSSYISTANALVCKHRTLYNTGSVCAYHSVTVDLFTSALLYQHHCICNVMLTHLLAYNKLICRLFGLRDRVRYGLGCQLFGFKEDAPTTSNTNINNTNNSTSNSNSTSSNSSSSSSKRIRLSGFGHVGMGGSAVLCDPASGISFAM
jgi:hypothetical protein